ncbi:zinc finger protein 700-like [Scaptodrosophila lebanonensis]|uniref:Zinc finger protein 700-like n=1 Tax=Drosophila lebanonensis TaxID=7225 RepID=A0A6J2THS7_DROLE|nr:zinc finger protein 700-like [Scaptodrosophila lebanonensis]
MPLQCRTCGGLTYKSNSKNLFEAKNAPLLDEIELFLGTQLVNKPELPTCICVLCVLDLNQVIIFRERCVRTQKLFLNQYNDRKVTAIPVPDTEYDDDYDDNEEISQEVYNEVAALEAANQDVDEIDDDFEDARDLFGIPEEDKTAQDPESLIATMQKEFISAIDESSVTSGEDEDNQDFTDSSGSNEESRRKQLPDSTAEADGLPSKPAKSKTNSATSSTKYPTSSEIDTNKKHAVKKKYVSWKCLTEEEIVERKRQMRRRDHVCDQCGRHFTDQSNFKLHMLRHTGVKNYECTECGKKYYTEHLLSLHVRISHKGEKPYVCKHCGRAFHNSTSRSMHERIHTNIRPYACKTCSKTFNSASGRKRHELIHTGERPYHCEICNQTFQRNTHLKSHNRSKQHRNNERSLVWSLSRTESE